MTLKTYHVDVSSWEDSTCLSFFAPNKEAAFRAAFKVANRTTPGYEIVRLWGEGKLLWTFEDGWLPPHKAF